MLNRLSVIAPKALLVLTSLFLSACNFNLDEIEAPIWEPELLLPAAQSSIDLTDISVISQASAVQELAPSDFGIPTEGFPTGQISMDLGPFPIDWFEGLIDLNAHRAVMELDMVSNLPFPITPGTNVRVRSAFDGHTVLFTTIEEEIPAGGQLYFKDSFKDFSTPGELELWLEDVTVDLATGMEMNGASIEVDFEIDFKEINQARVFGSSTINYADTAAFEFDFGSESLSADGRLILRSENGFPLGATLDVIFLDEVGSEVDRLTAEPSEVPVPPITSDGFARGAVGSEIFIDVSADRIDMIRRSAQVVFNAEIYAPQEYNAYTATDENQLDIQLIADIQLQVQP